MYIYRCILHSSLRPSQTLMCMDAQVALAWVLTRPGVTAPLFGATQAAHVDAAVEATSIELSAAELRSLESAYEPKPLAGTG